VDIQAICTIAKANGIKVSVDNTVATPYLQQPFALGADFVFHSATKFLNGHGSALHGVMLGKDLEFMNKKAWKWHALMGGNSNAFDAYLLIQGMKTLEIRMERHCSTSCYCTCELYRTSNTSTTRHCKKTNETACTLN
jgi:methionine-gamma-lyase